jgi:hypothetical protein
MQIKIVTVDFRLSQNARAAIRWALLPLTVLLGSMAVARAYDTTWIASSSPVSAMKLKADLDEVQTRLAAVESGSKGPVITAWIPYVPVMETQAGVAVTAAASTGQYRRVGDSAEVILVTQFQSTPNTGTNWYEWTLPPGLAIDTSKILSPIAASFVGGGFIQQGVNNNFALVTYVRTMNTVSAAPNGNSTYYINDTSPIAFTTGAQVNLYFNVPIVGWTVTQ